MSPTEVWDSLFQSLTESRPAERLDRTWPSVVTSVDMKLAYDARTDRFRPVVLGDINANPEGIALVHDQNPTNNVLHKVATAYVSNIEGDNINIVIFLPNDVFGGKDRSWKNEESWLTRDKQKLVDAISALERVNNVYLSVDGDRLEINDEDMRFAKQEVDGYVNLNDSGERVLQSLQYEIESISKGANAPTAVWTPSLDKTGKAGLLEALSTLSERAPNVFVPKHRRIQNFQDGVEFRAHLNNGIVIKGPFGTYGDEVITVRKDEDIAQRIEEEENRVRSKRGNTFTLFDWEQGIFSFSSWEADTNYAVAEEMISNTFQRNGRSLKVVDIKHGSKRYPVDFVPLVVRTGSGPGVPSILVRLSGKDNLNANLGAKYTQLVSLEEALMGDVSFPGHNRKKVKIANQLARIAGRNVSLKELENAIQKGAYLAFASRNLAAFWAERSLEQK